MDVVHYRTLMPLARRHASNKVSISAHLVVTRTTKPRAGWAGAAKFQNSGSVWT